MTSDVAVPRVFVAGPVAWNLQVRVAELPRSGPDTVAAHSHRYELGGAAAGMTVDLARRGARVTLRTVVGDDREGRSAMAELRATGATVIAEIDPTGRTGQRVEVTDDHGARISLGLATPRLSEVLHRAQTWAALTAADAVVLHPDDAVRPLLAGALAVGVPVWVDLRHHDDRHDDTVTRGTHVFLTDDRLPDPAAFLRERIDGGARLVVCTRADRGVLALDADGRWYEPASGPPAGTDTDAFFGAALLALLGGATVGSALTTASIHAARRTPAPLR